MRQKLKKIFKNKFILFIIAAIFCGTMGVYAVTYFPSNQVTYNNSSSKLNSTDVQGAIDELYNTCKNMTSVSSGNTIYYTYKGSIYAEPINGGTPRFVNSIGGSDVTGMDVSGDYIYYSTSNGIVKSSINGGNQYYIFSGNIPISDLEVSGNYVYFVSQDEVRRISVNGGSFTGIIDGSATNKIAID